MSFETEEIWSEIIGYPLYMISSYGRVSNVATEQMLTSRPTGRGYYRVALYRDGQRKEYYVHQLVAQAFMGDWRPRQQVIHINGDKSNNYIGNLRMKRGNRGHVKDREYVREYTFAKRVKILETGESFRTATDAARRIDGSHSHIYACLRGTRSSHKGFTFAYVDEEIHYGGQHTGANSFG